MLDHLNEVMLTDIFFFLLGITMYQYIWWKKSEEQETGFSLFGIQTFSTAAEEVWGQNEIVSVTNMVVAANFELDEEVLVYKLCKKNSKRSYFFPKYVFEN